MPDPLDHPRRLNRGEYKPDEIGRHHHADRFFGISFDARAQTDQRLLKAVTDNQQGDADEDREISKRNPKHFQYLFHIAATVRRRTHLAVASIACLVSACGRKK